MSKNYKEHKKKADTEALKRLKTETPRKEFRYNGEIEIEINLESLAKNYHYKSCQAFFNEDILTDIIDHALYDIATKIHESTTYRLGEKNNNTFHIKKQIESIFLYGALATEVIQGEIQLHAPNSIAAKIAHAHKKTVEKLTPKQYRKKIPQLKTPEDITVRLTQPEKLLEISLDQNDAALDRILALKQNSTTC